MRSSLHGAAYANLAFDGHVPLDCNIPIIATQYHSGCKVIDLNLYLYAVVPFGDKYAMRSSLHGAAYANLAIDGHVPLDCNIPIIATQYHLG